MLKKRLLVARAIFPQVLESLAAHFEVTANQDDLAWDAATLAQHLRDKHALLATPVVRVDAELLAQCPELQAVANMAVGYNNLDLNALAARNIAVSNTPDVLTETTADLALGLLIACARRMGEGERIVRSGAWRTWRYDMLMGQDIHGSTLGVLGMGRIGRAIAKRAHYGFGMRVLYHNRSPLSAQDAALSPYAEYVDKNTLFAQAKHLIVALPYSAEQHHCVGAAELARMQPSATLINIGRGGLVDEEALCTALETGRLAAAGLDVFEGEPKVLPRLLQQERAVLTPHIGSASHATRLAMAELAAANLIDYATTGRMRTPIVATGESAVFSKVPHRIG